MAGFDTLLHLKTGLLSFSLTPKFVENFKSIVFINKLNNIILIKKIEYIVNKYCEFSNS